jgi:hypothetical protein
MLHFQPYCLSHTVTWFNGRPSAFAPFSVLVVTLPSLDTTLFVVTSVLPPFLKTAVTESASMDPSPFLAACAESAIRLDAGPYTDLRAPDDDTAICIDLAFQTVRERCNIDIRLRRNTEPHHCW